MLVDDLKQKAYETLGIKDGDVFFSPGRVNLIGEHIDYNGGLVFPCALSIGTYGIAKKRDDRTVNVYSQNFTNIGKVTFNLDNLVYDAKDDWANYVKGVAKEMNPPYGFDMYIYGNIPNGSGLSSSASLELLVAWVFNDYFNMGYDRVSLVKFSQKAENNFIGVMCGIMDQFIIGVAEPSCACLLNTSTLEYKQTKVSFGNNKLIIANTCKKRMLSESKYNERRAECEKALAILKNHININNLCDMSVKEFEENKKYLNDEILEKRVKHCVYENERTKACFNAFAKNDLKAVGKLLTESHKSLQYDYEVSGLHLDTIVDAFLSQKGVLGARMTGAGFGGCAIALVDEKLADSVVENVKKEYIEKTGLTPEFYIVNIGGGVNRWKA